MLQNEWFYGRTIKVQLCVYFIAGFVSNNVSLQICTAIYLISIEFLSLHSINIVHTNVKSNFFR